MTRGRAAALLLAPLVVLCLSACGDGTDAAGPEPDRVHLDEGFSFVPPPGWETAPSPVGTPAIFMIGETRGEFRMNLNVNVNDLPPADRGVDREFLDGLAYDLAPQYAEIFSNYVLIEHAVVDVGEHVGLRMSSQFDQGVHRLANVQYMFPMGPRLYVFTFTCRRADWDEMSPVFRRTGRSIRFD